MAAPTSLRDVKVKRFSPASLSDSLDATDEFPGACSKLVNLVPDLSTRNIWTCRPAAVQNANLQFQNSPNLPGGSNAGPATIYKVVGNIVYGLFKDNTLNVDTPFAYNLASNTWITVSGAGIKPSPAIGSSLQAGGIVTPTIDLVGVFVIVTHPSFSTPNFIGWFNISTPTSPSWNTGDLASGAINFASLGAPDWVRQFNGRAWFGCNRASQPSVIATDALALKCTNANQALTFGDNLFLTCASVLGLSNQLGGIIQSLMVFKGVTNIYQITGDFATTNITINTLNVATGTLFPNSICKTPLGLAFMSPSGVRIIDQNATVSDPIGAAGKGVTVPFLVNNNQINPYIAASCDSTTIRVAVTSLVGPVGEYWYNLVRKVWSGPHTFQAYLFDQYNGSFLCASSLGGFGGVTGLSLSETDPVTASVFTEGGTALTFTYQTASLEDNEQMALSELSEMQVVTGSAAAETVTVTLTGPDGGTINSSSYVANALGGAPALYPYRVDFPAQSVFNRMSVKLTGNSAAGVRLGDIWMRIKTLGYNIP